MAEFGFLGVIILLKNFCCELKIKNHNIFE